MPNGTSFPRQSKKPHLSSANAYNTQETTGKRVHQYSEATGTPPTIQNHKPPPPLPPYSTTIFGNGLAEKFMVATWAAILEAISR